MRPFGRNCFGRIGGDRGSAMPIRGDGRRVDVQYGDSSSDATGQQKSDEEELFFHFEMDSGLGGGNGGERSAEQAFDFDHVEVKRGGVGDHRAAQFDERFLSIEQIA